MRDTHLLKYHVVDAESGISVAAFIDRFTAVMWGLEYEKKVGRKLIVKTSDEI